MLNTRILDLSRLLPGPYCSMLLADLGCEVIKIEEPHTGDYSRWMPPFINGESARFLFVNRNKKSMTLNLKAEKGMEIFLKMVKDADVVLESFRPKTMERLGIGYGDALKVNPRIIYCSITAYGQDGPYAEKAAHDINITGIGGVLSITKDRALPGVQVADMTGGLLACIGILRGLIEREETGKGMHVDISMLDGVVSLLSIHAGEYFATRVSPVPEKMALSGGLACYNVYETRDGRFITLGALEPKFWNEFCTRARREDLIPQQFHEDQDTIKKELREIFMQKNQEEWLNLLHDVCTPVNALEEVFKDPQVVHRGMRCEVEHPKAGMIEQVGIPVKGLTTATMGSPPLFGEHTVSILKELGYSDAEVETLKEEGVI